MSTYTPPDYADWLNKIDAAIAKKIAGADVVNYSIGGMTFSKRSLQDLLEDREKILALYNESQAGGSVTLADFSGDC